jgi:hypothetical protein
VLQSLSGLGEIVAELEKQAASREDYDPEGESNEQEIVRKRLIPHPPCLKLSLVRGNDLVIKPDHITLDLGQQVFLIAEIDGADAGKPWPDREDLRLVFFSKGVKAAPLIMVPISDPRWSFYGTNPKNGRIVATSPIIIFNMLLAVAALIPQYGSV